MTDKKEPRKKSDTEKKAEKDAMVNLWMNNLGTDEEKSPEAEDTKKKS
jgi:hypothetical protein